MFGHSQKVHFVELMIPEQRIKLQEILKIEHPELTQKQWDVALELLLEQ